jgi:hypothetical protein
MSLHDTNLAFLVWCQRPPVPYTSVVLRPRSVDPGWTWDTFLRRLALKARIFYLGLDPVLPIILLSVRMKDHVVCRGLAVHVETLEHVKAPRPPVLEVRVRENPGIDHTLTLIIRARADVGK